MSGSNASQSIDDQAVEWFTLLNDPPVSDEVRAAFAEWKLADSRHARAYDELATLWDGLQKIGRPDEAPALTPVPPLPVQPVRRAEPVYRRWAVAASLAVVATTALTGSYAVYAPQGGLRALMADVRAAPGQPRMVTLADGSRVQLDGGSAMSVSISNRERRVSMIAGRAYFDVKHEAVRPFVVSAGTAEIRDIGTAFEVGHSHGRTDVAVAHGIVEMMVDGGPAVTLKAGQRVAYDGRFEAVEVARPNTIAAWRDRRIVFENARLSDVLVELERYGAPRAILFDARLGARRLTGAFDANAANQALATIASMAGARITRFGPVAWVRSAPLK
jgi:transmembrane sensor